MRTAPLHAFRARHAQRKSTEPHPTKGTMLMVRTMIQSMCPFLIVNHVKAIIAFYTDKRGFETNH
jgi:hypothetical protein